MPCQWLRPGEVYRALARRLPLGRFLPSCWQPRIALFHIGEEPHYKLLLGRQVIGAFDRTRGLWHIRAPFRFLVDERLLSLRGAATV